MVSFPCGRISTCSAITLTFTAVKEAPGNVPELIVHACNVKSERAAVEAAGATAALPHDKYLRFHPGVLHLVDEAIRHLQGHLLLLGVCSVA